MRNHCAPRAHGPSAAIVAPRANVSARSALAWDSAPLGTRRERERRPGMRDACLSANPREIRGEKTHPLRTQSLDALTAAVLDWALTHSQDPGFVRKSPSEVALYLLARRSALATAIELGRMAPPHLDYTPLPDTSPPPEELVIELLAGLLPVIGEATDLGCFAFGIV
jgi:hypothetical protein